MGQVTVNGPTNGDPVDATAMRTILEAIAAGVNTVEQEQLGVGCVGTDQVEASAITLPKLYPGFVQVARLNTTQNILNATESTFYRVGDGNNPMTITVTAPATNCYVILLGNIQFIVDPESTTDGGHYGGCGIRLVTGNTGTGSSISYGGFNSERYPVSTGGITVTQTVHGIQTISASETLMFGLGVTWAGEGASTAQASLEVISTYCMVAGILLPR